MASQAAHSLIGQTLRSYELRAVVGVGGFGIVYQAYQQLVERDVAIKVILPEYADNPEFIRRFESEAQIIAHLEHPFIVPLYDFWREPGGAYLVMRWLRGGSLRDLLLKSGPLDLRTTAHFLGQISEALTIAHSRGIVHQDIKPENILLDELQNAYLSDFGIAKTLLDETGVGEALQNGFGTAAYAAPEQIMQGTVTAQTDVYSLGMMLYELLTGGVPFPSEHEATILYRQLHESVPFIKREDIPPEVSDVIWRATAKKSGDRFPDTISLAEAFRRAIGLERQSTSLVVVSENKDEVQKPASAIATRLLFPPEELNPYKGLQAFSEADEMVFFGREDLIGRLGDRLLATENSPRFLAVVGPSGSGKSSVVQAGMIPRLRRGAIPGFERAFITEMHPGAEPFSALEAAVLRVSPTLVMNLSARLRDIHSGLAQVLEQSLPDSVTKFVLVIDQFEEIFTLVKNEEERDLFVNVLVQTLREPKSRFQVIVTLRADFYDRPLAYEGLGELLRSNTEVVLPLSLDGLQQAIVEPAKRVGVHLEQGLLSIIVEDVHRQSSALPLLQHALSELYNRRNAALLTVGAYRESGGVIGALAGRAEEIFQQLDFHGREAARRIFLHLIIPSGGAMNTSRRVHRAELMLIGADKSVVTAVLDAFGNYRLLTFDYDPISRSPMVQIAHEALIQAWARLKDWIDANQQDLLLHHNLILATQDWLKADRDTSFLATGSRLAQFEILLEKTTLILNEDEKQYLNASITLKRQTTKRIRLFVAGLAIFSILALALALFALDQRTTAITQRDRADQEAQVSRSRELAVVALTNQSRPDLSLLLSIEALNSADTFEARNSLMTTLQSEPHLASFLYGHSGGVRAVAFSPDGRFIASGGHDNLVMLWDLASGQSVGKALQGHTGWVNAVTFSPDGKLIASASEDGTVRLWDAKNGSLLKQPLTGHTDAVRDVTFSPNGQLLASAGADGTIRFWDVKSGASVGEPLTGHNNVVWGVAFSPDGKMLASAGADQTVRLWDVDTRQPVGDPLVGHTNWVLSVAFSPDGKILASGSADNSIMLWDVQKHEAIGQPLTGNDDWVRSIAFSPDGSQLVSGSADETVRLWDLRGLPDVTLEDTYRAHAAAVWDVAFRPDGKAIASAGADGSVLLWNLAPALTQSTTIPDETVMSVALNHDGSVLAEGGGSRTKSAQIHLWDVGAGTLRRTIQTPDGLITTLAYSPNGSLLASGGTSNVVRLWNTENGTLQTEFTIPQATTIYAVVFSPNGEILAAASDNPAVTLWDTATGTLQGTLDGHTDSVYSLAFSPNGRLLASGSRDATVRLWNVASKQPEGNPLQGHSDAVMSVAFSMDGQLLASGSRDTTVRLWDVASEQAHGEPLEGHSDWVTSVAFSPNNQLLASGSQDATLRLWNVATGRMLGLPFDDHSEGVNSVVFNPNGDLLISAGQTGTIATHNIALPSLLKTACTVANRNFSEAEWQQYFPNVPFHATCIESGSTSTP